MANDGGPAFPVHPEIELAPEDYYGGMRLRDYFAAAALPAIAVEWISWQMRLKRRLRRIR